MNFRINRKAKWYVLVGVVFSVFCMYYYLHFDSYNGMGFYIACILFPIGVFSFARAPIDGWVGKWAIPIYGLLWSALNWKFFNQAWESKGYQDGLDAGMLLIFFQVLGTGIAFVPKVQRALKYRLGYFLAIFIPAIFVYFLIFYEKWS